MKLAVKPFQIKLLLLAAGVLGLTLRATLYAAGTDEKGLLVTGYWAGTGVWLLTAAVGVLLILWCRKLSTGGRYPQAFPASPLSAAGAILAAVGFILTPVRQTPSPAFSTAETVLRFASATGLIYTALCRFSGKKPPFLLHSTVCLYLALRLVCQYRVWSADPQLQNYCFYLGAHIALMLAAYQLAAFDAGLGDHRKLWTAGLAAVYLCLLALPRSGESFFLLCCGIWILTNLSRPEHDTPAAAKEDHTKEDAI